MSRSTLVTRDLETGGEEVAVGVEGAQWGRKVLIFSFRRRSRSKRSIATFCTGEDATLPRRWPGNRLEEEGPACPGLRASGGMWKI